MKHFGHSGDLGDIIWALPTIKAAGGGKLFLTNHAGRTTFPMTQARVEAIRPLLEQQPYISEVVFAGDEISFETSINGFRDHFCHRRNVADAHLATHGFPFSLRNTPWLSVDTIECQSEVVFVRTARYHNDEFPWQTVVQRFGRHAAFLGTKEEHLAFINKFGNVRHIPTANLLEAARIIAGAQLFVGNQSCLHTIAEGLKQNIVLEVYPPLSTCIFNRMGVVNGWDADVELPDFPMDLPRRNAKQSLMT